MEENIRLRVLEKDDLSFLHKLFNNPDIMDYWFSESYMSMERLKEEYDKNKEDNDVREFILTNSNQEKLGFVGLYEIAQRHRNAEFAIIIDPEHQGKGYAKAATSSAMDYAFSVLNLHKLYLVVVNTNEKASHIYEKAGFQIEGKLKDQFFINGDYHDGIMMALFQKDYREKYRTER